MNSSETLEVTMHMVRDFFENKIFSTQRLLAHLAQTAESFNMEALPCGSVKVNVRTDLERSANVTNSLRFRLLFVRRHMDLR